MTSTVGVSAAYSNKSIHTSEHTFVFINLFTTLIRVHYGTRLKRRRLGWLVPADLWPIMNNVPGLCTSYSHVIVAIQVVLNHFQKYKVGLTCKQCKLKDEVFNTRFKAVTETMKNFMED